MFHPSCLQAKYHETIAAAGADEPDALFGLAESLQGGAEATLAACAALPDEALTAAVAQEADSQAAAALQESVAAYQRVLEGGQPRADALVCAGNALRWGPPGGLVCAGGARESSDPAGQESGRLTCVHHRQQGETAVCSGAGKQGGQALASGVLLAPPCCSTWAEVCARRDAIQALQLLQRAAEAYRAALQREEDALVGGRTTVVAQLGMDNRLRHAVGVPAWLGASTMAPAACPATLASCSRLPPPVAPPLSCNPYLRRPGPTWQTAWCNTPPSAARPARAQQRARCLTRRCRWGQALL